LTTNNRQPAIKFDPFALNRNFVFILNFDLYQCNRYRKRVDIARKLTIRRIALVLILDTDFGKKQTGHRFINQQKST